MPHLHPLTMFFLIWIAISGPTAALTGLYLRRAAAIQLEQDQ